MGEKVLKCKDFGVNCPAEFRGQSVMAILEQVRLHRLEAHGLKADQAGEDELMKMAAAKVREE